jgi:hypothetical protein
LQNALAEKAAWCVARWHAGLASKSLDFAFIQEISSPLIAGVAVVVVDWRRFIGKSEKLKAF